MNRRTRNAVAAAAAGLAVCGMLLGGAPFAGGVAAGLASAAGTSDSFCTGNSGNSDITGAVMVPTPRPIYDLGSFQVAGNVNTFSEDTVLVYINGAFNAQNGVNLDNSPTTYCVTVTDLPADQPGTITCGANTVTAIDQPAGGGPIQASLRDIPSQDIVLGSATLTAECPTISLTPPTITSASEPTRVLVTGSLFESGNPVALLVDSQPAGSTTADDTGGISAPITAQGLACGTHQVTASQQITVSPLGGPPLVVNASATLTVTACTAPPPPKLTINPDVLEPGEVTNATGTRFTPGVSVLLSWRLPGGGGPLETATVTPDKAGTFTTTFLVMLDDLPGPRQLVANQAGQFTTANALVEETALQPSNGNQLLFRG
ncbi:MAG TPA: hypothetical protein VGS19_10335 [Streptosporangiaceae bacterium]|nr:hypothetical protein [Streptosporangiaceae bacterium]